MKGHSLAVKGYVRHIGEQQLTVVVNRHFCSFPLVGTSALLEARC